MDWRGEKEGITQSVHVVEKGKKKRENQLLRGAGSGNSYATGENILWQKK